MKEPKIKPLQRVSEFSHEKLIVSAVSRLFCKVCRETLKRSTIFNHIKSIKHAESKLKLVKRHMKLTLLML